MATRKTKKKTTGGGANFMKKVHRQPALTSIKRKRQKLERQLKTLGRKYKVTLKKVTKRLSKKRR